MKLKTRVLLALTTLFAMVSTIASTASAVWQDTVNETVQMVIGLLPLFGDLLTGVGDHLIWPVVYILIILSVAGVILGLFSMITSVVFAVVLAVRKFSGGLGNIGGRGKY